MFVMKAGGTRQRQSVMVVIKAGSLSAMPDLRLSLLGSFDR
jgi:hypothetical protein